MGVLGNRIATLLEERDWTHGQLAAYAQVDRSYISLIIAGKRLNVGSVHLCKIAHALDTSVDYLVGLIDDPRPLTVIQSSESRELASQIGGLLADPDVEELFKLILRMTPEQKVNVRAFAMFLVSPHNT